MCLTRLKYVLPGHSFFCLIVIVTLGIQTFLLVSSSIGESVSLFPSLSLTFSPIDPVGWSEVRMNKLAIFLCVARFTTVYTCFFLYHLLLRFRVMKLLKLFERGFRILGCESLLFMVFVVLGLRISHTPPCSLLSLDHGHHILEGRKIRYAI
jgi:hypothetical protein